MANRFKYRFRLMVGGHTDSIPDLDENGVQRRNRDGTLAFVDRTFQARRAIGDDPGDQPVIETNDDLAAIFNARGAQFTKFQRAHDLEAAAGPYAAPAAVPERPVTVVGALTETTSPPSAPASDLPPGPDAPAETKGRKEARQAGR